MIKITSDSTCDLSPEILNQMDITLYPLYILVDEKQYRDGVDIVPADIFRYVDEEKKTCKTAAINVYDYERFFAELSRDYEAVIHICIGSGFSSCYQNAAVAAAGFDNVYVIDSRNLSSGSGHIVYDAALMANSGMPPEEICSRLEEIIPRVDASFVINELDYLYKGGRCSGLEALGAKVLQLRPCIEVIDGRMKVGKKYRGSFDHCLAAYVRDKLADKDDIDLSRIFITHTRCFPETVEAVRQAVMQYADFDEIIMTRAGGTISCHCGPMTLGILFKRKTSK
ncbi:MAG: DegV family protein [Oscillospiraceae bacterium]|jgi:DegV family protein with EDD domain